MNLWILKFLPYEGSLCHALFFTSKARAQALRAAALAANGVVILKDDFNIELAIDPKRSVIMLTDCIAAASFSAALTQANVAAARTYQLSPADLYDTVQ